MSNQEFSIEFDILYNNISSNKAPGLNDYEKSVFLTKAQEDIITELYSGRNTTYNSFEETEEQRRYLNSLIWTEECESINDSVKLTSAKSYVFSLPYDVMFITYEVATIDGKEVSVYPVSQDELSKIIKNPFRGPSKNRVLRLDTTSNLVELISNYNIDNYKIRYVKKPNPIILTSLEDDSLSINGTCIESECELDSSLHRTILDRAVALALQTMYSK